MSSRNVAATAPDPARLAFTRLLAVAVFRVFDIPPAVQKRMPFENVIAAYGSAPGGVEPGTDYPEPSVVCPNAVSYPAAPSAL